MLSAVPSVEFREYQATSLACFVSDDPSISPPNVIIQGHQSSGKTLTLQKFFEQNPQIHNCWLNPVELVTWKPLLQHVARSVSNKLTNVFPHFHYDNQDALEAEDFYFLIRVLDGILSCYQELEERINLYVVLDGFDQLKELDLELLPKFLKLHEQLSTDYKVQLKFIYIVRDVAFLSKYSTYNVPTIIFPRYKHEQVAEILLQNKTSKYAESGLLVRKIMRLELDPEDSIFEQISENYIKLIIQAFHSYTGNDIVALTDIMDSKWEGYVESITAGNIYEPLSLYRSNIELYTKTGDTFTTQDEPDVSGPNKEKATAYELSSISKYLLVAAYLCSYLEPRYDSKIFSKKSHLRAGRSSYGRRSKMETNPRYLQPSLFQLERLFSIFQAIFPLGEEPQGKSSIFHQAELMKANVEVYENLAELNSLKLITTATPKNVDYLSYKLKWKINVPWEIITEISSSLKFDIAEYFSGLHN
ncbi:LANO_0G02498g1_1 [Lachancea nothofagi CBS 11611]|uniref:LANO_0G02498g1_1 n=1 Tax=Lachancea nothofagi CBS 11611 TaxID=1266666 RepID=A0A1G4KFP0_9SACH|nr:LANO_0G02498g1_1 [Lachancea nothofagi CBS 11611]